MEKFRNLKFSEFLSFIEMKPFSKFWQKLRLTDDDLLLLQMAIMSDPKRAPVVSETGGLRKLYFSPLGLSTGKRDAMRVCYTYFEEHKTIALAIVYPKSLKVDLTSDEKKSIKRANLEIRKWLAQND